jgi:ribulose-bisphosphate carboxylase large chain
MVIAMAGECSPAIPRSVWTSPPTRRYGRLTGIDHLHAGGMGSKFWEADESVTSGIRACLTPIAADDAVLPVLSSGQWAGQLPETYRQAGCPDFLYLCGAGILAHPDGPSAGVQSLAQAYQAARKGIDLEVFARDHDALRGAIDTFGPLLYN